MALGSITQQQQPTLFVSEITDVYERQNFQVLQNYFFNNNQMVGFKFFSLSFPNAIANYKLAHNLGFIPKDIIVSSTIGAGSVQFNNGLFDKNNMDISVTGACRIRFFAGTYWNDNSTFASAKADVSQYSSLVGSAATVPTSTNTTNIVTQNTLVNQTTSTTTTTTGNLTVSSVQTGPYTVQSTDQVVLVNGTTGAFTVTLPTAVGVTGKVYTIKRVDQTLANQIKIATPVNVFMDGASTRTLATQYEQFTFVSDGTNWQVQSHTYPQLFTAYTPTANGLGTLSNVNFLWQRVGSAIRLVGTFTIGTVAASQAQLTFPTGLFTNSLLVGTICAGTVVATGNGALFNVIAPPTVNFIAFSSTTSTTWTSAGNGSGLFGNSQTLSMDVVIPIQGWEG
jgi:hypothetical protein